MTPRAQTVAFTDSSTPSLDVVEDRLTAHLPYSLPLLRRVQFARYAGARSEESRLVIVSEISDDDENGNGDKNGVADGKFTAAYVDPAGGPDTQMWLFSTLEVEPEESLSSLVEGEYTTQLRALTDEIVALVKTYGKELKYPGNLLLGTLHSRVKSLLKRTGRVTPRDTGIYDKWLFQTEDLPTYSSTSGGAAAAEEESRVLGEGMKWDTASDADLEVAIARTNLPRTPKTLRMMPSLVIRTEDGTPAAWAFLGLDGSLTSLHCEPAYRRRGLAKTLASRLMRRGPGDFAAKEKGWSSADVSPDNAGSRAMCKSLGGIPRWQVSWILFDVTERGGK